MMAARLKLTIAYDGAPFAGWQSQAHGNTIQDHLEQAFQHVTRKRIYVHGAGRTDAGVHALAQCAHVDLPDRNMMAKRWQSAVNGLLPPTIRLLRCRYVPSNFHARFSAKSKVYRYRVWAAPVLPPFEAGRAWHVKAPLDFQAVARSAAAFRGRHDFAAFAANRGKAEPNTVRTIFIIHPRQIGPLITLEFKGDGFLYKMVRMMVGSIVRCGLGKETPADLRSRMRSGRTSAFRFVAPAAGLVLVRVSY
jgi:tRNA pseudouridine38-40 synthase